MSPRYSPSDFPNRFAEVWASPTPEALVALLADDVVLRQPHRPALQGKAAALREFKRLLRWFPGLHGVVERASDDGETVFIEWCLRLPIGGELLSWRAVDRFRLRDGLAVERVVYFDQLALISVLARYPRLWPGYVRYRLSI